MRPRTAAIFGLLVAAAVPAILLAATTPMIARGDLLGRLMLLPVFYGFSAMVTLPAGLLLLLLFERLGILRFWLVLASGFVIGAVVGLALKTSASFVGVAVLGLIGVASALVFWSILRQGRDT
jgi:hypothetical protein